MSGFLDRTPTIQVVMENPIHRRRYPPEGEALAVIDTGYEGFLAIPREIFHELGLDSFTLESRTLSLANGNLLASMGTLGKLNIPQLKFAMNGFYETYPGIEEIILGTEALSRTKVLLDYCLRHLRLEVCP